MARQPGQVHFQACQQLAKLIVKLARDVGAFFLNGSLQIVGQGGLLSP